MSEEESIEFRRLLDDSFQKFSQEQSGLYTKWDLEGSRSWELVPEAGIIGFGQEGGVFVVADVQIIGSYIPSESLWQWAWDHDGLDDALKVDAIAVREHGLEKGYDALTTGQLEADPIRVGGLMALTVELTGSQGIYEGHDEGISVMIAMRNLRHERPQSGKLDDLF